MIQGEGAAYGWFGDDFTGATDTLATIAERGHLAFLFLGVPDLERLTSLGPLDAVGIASAARALGADAMRAEIEPAAGFFAALGVRLLHYKCCSTFDSAPEVGNLAVALEALGRFNANGPAFVLGGQPSLQRYCAFSNLFALGGGDVHRLDRHPTMSRHPVTPMGEADLRRHLEALGLGAVETIHWPALEADVAFGPSIERWEREGVEAVVIDALTASHVEAAGRILRSRPARSIAIGASSVAEAWFEDRGRPLIGASDAAPGPVLAIAGSLSETTREQVNAATAYERLEIEAESLLTSAAYRAGLVERAQTLLCDGRNVLLTTRPVGGERPEKAQEALAARSADLVAAILDIRPVRRLLAAGGDTSSRVAQALGLWGLSYEGRAAKGVTVSRSRSDHLERDGMMLLLKGGQMGDEALFDRFAAAG